MTGSQVGIVLPRHDQYRNGRWTYKVCLSSVFRNKNKKEITEEIMKIKMRPAES